MSQERLSRAEGFINRIPTRAALMFLCIAGAALATNRACSGRHRQHGGEIGAAMRKQLRNAGFFARTAQGNLTRADN